MSQRLVAAARNNPWAQRPNKNAYWRGAARTSSSRDALIACNGKAQVHILGKTRFDLRCMVLETFNYIYHAAGDDVFTLNLRRFR